jgi:hypothetical protein
MIREKSGLKIGLSGGAIWACSWWEYYITKNITIAGLKLSTPAPSE